MTTEAIKVSVLKSLRPFHQGHRPSNEEGGSVRQSRSLPFPFAGFRSSTWLSLPIAETREPDPERKAGVRRQKSESRSGDLRV